MNKKLLAAKSQLAKLIIDMDADLAQSAKSADQANAIRQSYCKDFARVYDNIKDEGGVVLNRTITIDAQIHQAMTMDIFRKGFYQKVLSQEFTPMSVSPLLVPCPETGRQKLQIEFDQDFGEEILEKVNARYHQEAAVSDAIELSGLNQKCIDLQDVEDAKSFLSYIKTLSHEQKLDNQAFEPH
ncbi:hypothetical protein [Neptuniibacter sp. QD37_11]|uniref:hypothetical protein n=1 Tax=Neptuniibacter sp. QD37_11 TaxID=3398209 RepID=UPI0039F44E48